MNKTELVDAITEKVGDRKTATAAVDAVLEAVQRAVSAGERVVLGGFGVFEKIDRVARTGQTSLPTFRPGRGFTNAVNAARLLGPAAQAGARLATAPARAAGAGLRVVASTAALAGRTAPDPQDGDGYLDAADLAVPPAEPAAGAAAPTATGVSAATSGVGTASPVRPVAALAVDAAGPPPAHKAAPGKSAPTKSGPTKSAPRKAAPAEASANRPAARKAAPSKAPKKVPADKATPKTVPADKATPKKVPADKATPKKVPADKATPKKAPTRRAPAKASTAAADTSA